MQKILFLAHLLPWPPHGGGQIKSWQTLHRLAADSEITLVAFSRGESERRQGIEALQPLCRGGIRLIPLNRSRVADLAALVEAERTGLPWLIARDHSEAFTNAVNELVAANWYDVLWADHLQMAQFLPSEDRRTNPTFLLDQHNAESRLYARIAELPGLSWPVATFWRRESERLQRYERDICANLVTTIHCVSTEDARALSALDARIAGKITITPILPPTDLYPSVKRDERSRNLLFVGTLDWPPNVDGLLWFVDSVWPMIQESAPDCTLTVVGTRASRAIGRIARQRNIEMIGFAEDLTPYAKRAAAFVAPIRAGSGVRVKILTAQALGLPVVTTSIGAEGIRDLCESLHIADSPEQFAQSCLHLIR